MTIFVDRARRGACGFAAVSLVIGAVACSANDTSARRSMGGSASGPGASGPGSLGGGSGQAFGAGFDLGGDDADDGPRTTISIGQRNHPSHIDDCASSNVDPQTLAALQGGGAPHGMRFLYPYEGTVFPRGLLAPVVQWEQAGASDWVLLTMTSSQFSYQGCFPSPAVGALGFGLQLLVPRVAWEAAGEWSGGRGDPVRVSITSISGGNVVGPLTQELTFALAKIKGAVYYNTYTSPIGNTNGAVLKILPGEPAPAPFLTEVGVPPVGPCVSCHALSADGSTMTANRHFYPGQYESLSFDVMTQNPNMISAGIPEAGFAAVFPDGSRAVTNGPPNPMSSSPFFPAAPGNVAGLVPSISRLIDVRSGATLPAQGWDGVVPHAQMPMFSPDGRMIVYNDADKGGGHSLWVADFDAATNTFSSHRQIYHDPVLYAGWPFFTPDGSAVIFQAGTRSDFVSQLPTPDGFGRDGVGRGHLRIVFLADSSNVALDAANGYRGGASYLPFGLNDYEFFPTVSPVAAGGYFWVFFTSRRQYGNTFGGNPGLDHAKKLWVAAVDLGALPGADPSHPAFLLPGQELESGNLRAFAALEPCKEDGQYCESGTECCSGFCIIDEKGVGVCGPPQECSNIDDRCAVAADCCDSSARCVGNFCAEVLR